MSSTHAASTRKCPVCGAGNSNLSLFCAECGSSLNVPPESDTAAYEPLNISDDVQQTSVFEPASPTRNPSPASSNSSSAGLGAVPSSWERTAASPVAAERVWSSPEPAVQPIFQDPAPRGVRGFFLGLVAVLLLLAIFLLWGWASILDQDTRDSIRDFFGFLG